MIEFIEKNVKKFPGGPAFVLTCWSPKNKYKASMYTMDNGFEMNEEMAMWLQQNPELEVQVVTH
jgi:DNA polymerase-3 subunit alpha